MLISKDVRNLILAMEKKRNFWRIAEISAISRNFHHFLCARNFYNMPEISRSKLLKFSSASFLYSIFSPPQYRNRLNKFWAILQKFLLYARNFWTRISAKKFWDDMMFINFPYLHFFSFIVQLIEFSSEIPLLTKKSRPGGMKIIFRDKVYVLHER